jgi:hypothetical protein
MPAVVVVDIGAAIGEVLGCVEQPVSATASRPRAR